MARSAKRKSVNPPRRPLSGGYARGEATRLRIIRTALDVFGALGFEAASTRLIAHRAGDCDPSADSRQKHDRDIDAADGWHAREFSQRDHGEHVSNARAVPNRRSRSTRAAWIDAATQPSVHRDMDHRMLRVARSPRGRICRRDATRAPCIREERYRDDAGARQRGCGRRYEAPNLPRIQCRVGVTDHVRHREAVRAAPG